MGAPIIRPLTLEEVDQLIDWAAGEGWNPGLADAAAFHAVDPEGFLGCFVEGEMAACISALAYDEGFGFIGLYICHPRFRGQGFGRMIWDAGMNHLGGRVIGLDGVPEQQANYAKMGFAPLYETVRWSGSDREASNISSSRRRVTAADFAPILAFDARHFPARRVSFLTHWLSAPRDAFMATDDGDVTGYAVLRRCREGNKIGPIFARDEETAEALLGACLAASDANPVQLDVPGYQVGLTETLKRKGFQPSFMTARMYRGPAPAVSLASIYAITTLELG